MHFSPQDLSKIAKLSVAIAVGRRIAFIYDSSLRVAEIHAVGTGPNGVLVRAFQVGGESHTTDTAAWRLFSLDKMTNIVGLDEVSEAPRPGYKMDDAQMQSVIVQVPA